MPDLFLHIQAWASALPSDSNRQCEKPPIVGRATSTDTCAFLFPLYSGVSVEPEKWKLFFANDSFHNQCNEKVCHCYTVFFNCLYSFQ